eukprot:282523_1
MSDSKPWPQTNRPLTILGAAPFGKQLPPTQTYQVINEYINEMNELHFDGAYFYQNEEEYSTNIPQISSSISKANISTKVCPMFPVNEPNDYTGLTEYGVKKQFEISLNKLKRNKVDILYIHWIDVNTNINITLKAINDLYKQNKFKRFGLSNFYSWQVSQIYYICKMNNYVLPTVYQGHYNPICRVVESDLFPCLRYFNIDFYAYGALANGILAGSYGTEYTEKDDKAIRSVEALRGRRIGFYLSHHMLWRKTMFEAWNVIKNCIDEVYGNNIDYADIALRWMVHHSQLTENDGIIVGISKYKYFKPTMKALKYGKCLDNKVVKAFDDGWNIVKKEDRGYVQWNDQNGSFRTDEPKFRCKL